MDERSPKRNPADLSASSGSSRPTGRPPLDFPEIIRTGIGGGLLNSTIPPLSELEDAFVLPERIFFDRLEDRARRAELLTALLQAKGLPPARGVRALQAALAAIVASAEEAHLPSLGSLAQALHAAIGELGIPQEPMTSTRTLDVLVLDESEISRDLVALAVEAQGHIVRCASGYEDFVRQLHERLPDLIVTEVELTNAPARHFVANLVDLLSDRRVPFVFFSGAPKETLDDLALKSRARAAINKLSGIAALLSELERVLQKL